MAGDWKIIFEHLLCARRFKKIVGSNHMMASEVGVTGFVDGEIWN